MANMIQFFYRWLYTIVIDSLLVSVSYLA